VGLRATTRASLHDGRQAETLASAEPMLRLIESGGRTDPSTPRRDQQFPQDPPV
jgi:hypothetical protein